MIDENMLILAMRCVETELQNLKERIAELERLHIESQPDLNTNLKGKVE
jgi:hypothetical protein